MIKRISTLSSTTTLAGPGHEIGIVPRIRSVTLGCEHPMLQLCAGLLISYASLSNLSQGRGTRTFANKGLRALLAIVTLTGRQPPSLDLQHDFGGWVLFSRYGVRYIRLPGFSSLETGLLLHSTSSCLAASAKPVSCR